MLLRETGNQLQMNLKCVWSGSTIINLFRLKQNILSSCLYWVSYIILARHVVLMPVPPFAPLDLALTISIARLITATFNQCKKNPIEMRSEGSWSLVSK